VLPKALDVASLELAELDHLAEILPVARIWEIDVKPGGGLRLPSAQLAPSEVAAVVREAAANRG
jgi:hypothetical protein